MKKNYISPEVTVIRINFSGSMLTTSNMGMKGDHDGSITIGAKERGEEYEEDPNGWVDGLW